MKVEYITFEKRASRTAYLAVRFKPYIIGRVLDVGCDEAHLKKLFPHTEYTGVDVSGAPDVRLDLERTEKLPFESMSYDCVLCIDVLEHLDNLHLIFGELARVTKKYLIISLPNCWVGARRPVHRGKGSFGHYGLPPDPPPDRHKWFFSLTEARLFLENRSERHGLAIVERLVTEKPRPFPVRLVRRIRYPRQERYLNRYAHTLWTVMEKESPEPGLLVPPQKR